MNNTIYNIKNLSHRLQVFIDSMNMSSGKFEKETGNSVSSIVRVLKGESDLSYKAIERIHVRFPELNIDWLVTGRGSMLRPQEADTLPDIADQLDRIQEATQLIKQSLFPSVLSKK